MIADRLEAQDTESNIESIDIGDLEADLGLAGNGKLMNKNPRESTPQLERLLQEKTERQDHLSSLGLMVSSIFHGIKGLMVGLDGGIYIMDSGIKNNDHDKIHDGREIIKLMSERLRKMVIDILYCSKERELHRRQVDALHFAEALTLFVIPRIQSHPIELVKDFDPSTGVIEIDPDALHSALDNILDNAVDACMRDTSKCAHLIRFEVQADIEDIIFTVHDDGVGMDRQTKERLFELFYSSKGEKGTGLGLFIARKVIGQHGGSITFDSKAGIGTTFTVRIPKNRIDPGEPKE